MLDSYYTYLNFPVDMNMLVSKINEYIQQNKDKFYLSNSKLLRLDFNYDINSIINKIMPFTVSDAGVFRNPPGWNYPVHRDSVRKFAVNMVLVDEHPDFDVRFVNPSKTETYPIHYIKNQFVLINTQQFHYVKNNNINIDRYCVSIGCTSDSYSNIRELFANRNNIGLYQY
jgi:hypothetical protein